MDMEEILSFVSFVANVAAREIWAVKAARCLLASGSGTSETSGIFCRRPICCRKEGNSFLFWKQKSEEKMIRLQLPSADASADKSAELIKLKRLLCRAAEVASYLASWRISIEEYIEEEEEDRIILWLRAAGSGRWVQVECDGKEIKEILW